MDRRERQVQARRQDILVAALQLFETKGFSQTSMEEIAETADVARGTLYNHFQSKVDILVALRTAAKDRWQAEALRRAKAGESPVAMIERVIVQATEWIDDHPHMAGAFQDAVPLLMARHGLKLGQHIIIPPELVRMAQEKQELTSALPAEMVAFLLDMTVRFCLMEGANGPDQAKISDKVKAALSELLARLA
jgi:AcrR family transcriptional regulator